MGSVRTQSMIERLYLNVLTQDFAVVHPGTA